MTLPTSPIAGARSRWVWPTAAPGAARPAIPAGVWVDHGDHGLAILWVGEAKSVDLVSLAPLTLDGVVCCPGCDAEDTVTDGVLVAAAPLAQDGDT